jgi:chemotaxis protein CheC
MGQKVVLTKNELPNASSVKLLSGGISNAVGGLSKMVGKDTQISSFGLRRILIKDVPNLFGGPEAIMVGVYLKVSGYADGHMIVAYQPKTAFDLIDLLLGQSPGSTKELSEWEHSVLGEVGNIMGSFFLNYLADITGVRYRPSPPVVMMDMAGAILDAALANLLEQGDDTYIVETTFSTKDRQVAGTFLIVPIPELPAYSGQIGW